eukprot:CAMPEP_0201488508 /NCGR_PEP_ID=MMETSP0151_2-20130828/18676_1 /ASSEMBLY_ACC=CAM_ASM_000257 /TAXON_ID=200890 /ORGANISM="Paramoeba atlantica, Strain 621/1 / CCAP 1560/9" /LENGTH=252 /DNA_ID=CAMNT_0047873819 /DNA_START=69 /DNA_END=827 /DNA_ORIENTATION=+
MTRKRKGEEVPGQQPKKKSKEDQEELDEDVAMDQQEREEDKGEQKEEEQEGKGLPPFPQIGNPAPSFRTEAALNGEIHTVQLSDFKNKWVVLFFYPLDFTFVCPTEILEFSDSNQLFKEINTEVLGISVDSVYSHLAWIQSGRKEGGLGGKLNIPLLADVSHTISRQYGALYGETGHTLRATYLIDPSGTLRHFSMNDPPVGRSVPEILRLVKGFQYVDTHGEVCPVNWTPGSDTIIPHPEKKSLYFSKHAD